VSLSLLVALTSKFSGGASGVRSDDVEGVGAGLSFAPPLVIGLLAAGFRAIQGATDSTFPVNEDRVTDSYLRFAAHAKRHVELVRPHVKAHHVLLSLAAPESSGGVFRCGARRRCKGRKRNPAAPGGEDVLGRGPAVTVGRVLEVVLWRPKRSWAAGRLSRSRPVAASGGRQRSAAAGLRFRPHLRA
jgi:hypothetical protein